MITVVIPVSPIAVHPSTEILDETLNSIRHHLPDAEIIVTFDGVRNEHERRRTAYEEFIRRALWRLDHHYSGCVPFIFDTHTHQVGMLRAVLDEIRTPLMMYVESDTPLVTDEPIDWAACMHHIESGGANVIRFAHEAQIHPEHEHLAHGIEGVFARTSQWSQRPHLTSVAYYRRILNSHFTPDARCFIEDVMHSVCVQAHVLDGMDGWLQHRLWLYHPEGGNIKRSYTTDGRAGEPKLDSTQVF